ADCCKKKKRCDNDHHADCCKKENIQFQLQQQQQKQEQLQDRTQNDTNTISNVGNPVVNVNVSNDTSSNGVSIPQTNSAFSAATQGSTVLQPLAGTLPLAKVFFPNELLDLGNEYDPSTSTFTAKNSGVYLFITSLNFFPDPIGVPYQVRVQIQVNGSSVGTDDEFTRGDSGDLTLVISLSAKVNLNAGDTVEVFASSTTPGVLLPGKATRFEGARFPSPTA
ncbi:hypothetical protein, partial [Peribacillus frigoritolerans]|uniref:hypothetical protein n=1 Tax=Peribacillus frigoritolerans TaxID=450367 RepID=UPI003D2AB699